MNKSPEELKQEIMQLKESVHQEKLKKAEEVFTQRFVLTAIIFVIIFIFLMAKIDDMSAGTQWVFIIIFFAIALFTAGRVFATYTREKDEINHS